MSRRFYLSCCWRSASKPTFLTIVLTIVVVLLGSCIILRRIRVGVLIMATGNYARFTVPLVTTARQFFLTDPWQYKVTYYIFTDNGNEAAYGMDVVLVDHHKRGWPLDTLMRCGAYLAFADRLRANADYLFSLDADMLMLGRVGPEILADMAGTLHPGFIRQPRVSYTYDRNEKSRAFVNDTEGWQYFIGNFYGGLADNVLEMCNVTTAWATEDLSQGITALWHDESYLNRYFIDQPPTTILSPSYSFAEGYSLPYKKKIIWRRKFNEQLHVST